jgi:Domain of unknown function (DUF6249)
VGHRIETLVIMAVLGLVLGTCTVIVFLVLRYLARSRELLSAERRAAIEKGLDAPLDLGVRPRRLLWNPLKTAVLLIGIGVAITVVLLGEREWVLGLFVIIIGLTNLVYYRLGGRREWEREVALREELHRAYLRRLSPSAAPPPVEADQP